MRSDRNGSWDANSRLRAFNVCHRPACPEGGFGVGVRGRRPRAHCRHGPGEAFQQAPDVLLRTVPPSSCTAGHCFYGVQSSARRSARGAGNHPRSREGSQFFRLSGNRVLKTAFVLRDGPLAPSPSSSGPSLRALVRTHQGSMLLRCHLRLRFRSVGRPLCPTKRPIEGR